MELYYAITSPYSRKVRVLILEKELGNHFDMTFCHPFTDAEKLQRVNPLRKIPVLVLDDGSSLYDSLVICEYLDSLDSKILMIPAIGMERFQVLRQQAIADGIMDVAILSVYEYRRADAEKSMTWLTRWETTINASLDSLETEILNCATNINIGQITVGCALGYLDFRLPALNWRNERVNLTRWYDKFATRESMKQTFPADI
jgi:glutathione S-transferase